ncbi:hypothetical protein [Caballeronia zhejiangensis]|uniref:hypothetical protein n=1 Tax=Caballeronia zhejiangensis TaxID=871203 RepID=UPI001F51E4DF|nr:hypothetical protein [Caballeronia zhejiangensis]MCI1046948.1 hypothetical protein [Caballeronia zhejiangensis]
MNDITTLATQLNALQSYPSMADMHTLAQTLQQYSADEVNTKLIPALTNSLLVTDIKRLMAGHLPSGLTAPVVTVPTAPGQPGYPGVDLTKDAGAAAGTEPQIKP